MVKEIDINWNINKDFKPEDYENWLRKLVHGVMKKFSKNPRWDFDELMSEAWLAFLESANKFNPEYSTSLIGYSRPYIINRLHEFISVNMYTFKVRYYNIKGNKETLVALNKLESSLWTDSKSKNTKPSYLTPLELHSSGSMRVDEQVALNEDCTILKDIVNKTLKKRERRAIVRRHKNNESFQEIGDKLGISKESARRTYHKAIEKIKIKAQNAGIVK